MHLRLTNVCREYYEFEFLNYVMFPTHAFSYHMSFSTCPHQAHLLRYGTSRKKKKRAGNEYKRVVEKEVGIWYRSIHKGGID